METAPPNPATQLVAFVERIKAEREYWAKQQFEPLPDPPESPRPERYRLEFRPGFAPYQPTISLEQARSQLSDKMWGYATESRPNRVLLVKAQPGLGKTYAAVDIAQKLADLNARILYAMPTHKHYETLQDFPHFDHRFWYHWLATDAESPDTGNTMCLYPEEMALWNQKGYPAMKLCDSLCAAYKPNCEFRRQMYRPERIIAGTHNHVSMGMQISDFSLVIVDELPLSAFLRPRHIPKDGIPLRGGGPAVEFSQELYQITASGDTFKGKALLDKVGPVLGDVYAQFEDYGSALPIMPWISRPDDVDAAAWWYLPDILTLLVQEYRAWESGAAEWLERVIVGPHGLDLLQRAEPWDGLPARVIVLDATGNSRVYQQLFGRNIEIFAPNVERKGKVYQVVNRLNGKGTFLEIVPETKDRKRLSKQGIEALELCKSIISKIGSKRPGAVTFQEAVPEYNDVFGVGHVMYFHNMRGSNDLLECDAGFIIGAPQPKDTRLMEAVKVLYPKRSKPFNLIDHEGFRRPARSEEMRSYQYFDERGQAWRMIGGFWNDQDLNALADILREQELVQAIHRFRPITREVPIFVLTSIPSDERLDAIYEDPRDLLEVPEGIGNWQAWLKLVAWLDGQYGRGLQVTYQDIADVTGMPEATIRRWKWLDVISSEFPDLWQTDRIAPSGRGQPKRILTPRNNARPAPL